jgi:hypothetical protein
MEATMTTNQTLDKLTKLGFSFRVERQMCIRGNDICGCLHTCPVTVTMRAVLNGKVVTSETRNTYFTALYWVVYWLDRGSWTGANDWAQETGYMFKKK